MIVEEFELDSLQPEETLDGLRDYVDTKHVDVLVELIREDVHNVDPIKVGYLTDRDNYGPVRIAGSHRCTAAKRLGLRTLPAEVVYVTSAEAVDLAAESNKKSARPWTPAEVERLTRIVARNHQDWSFRQIGNQVGISGSQAEGLIRAYHVQRVLGGADEASVTDGAGSVEAGASSIEPLAGATPNGKQTPSKAKDKGKQTPSKTKDKGTRQAKGGAKKPADKPKPEEVELESFGLPSSVLAPIYDADPKHWRQLAHAAATAKPHWSRDEMQKAVQNLRDPGLDPEFKQSLLNGEADPMAKLGDGHYGYLPITLKRGREKRRLADAVIALHAALQKVQELRRFEAEEVAQQVEGKDRETLARQTHSAATYLESIGNLLEKPQMVEVGRNAT